MRSLASRLRRREDERVAAARAAHVPVSISGLKTLVIGTSFLRQFLPTIDYPGRRLVLRARESAPEPGIEVPFALVHLDRVGAAAVTFAPPAAG